MCARFEVFEDLSRRVEVSRRLTVLLDGGDEPPDDLAALQGAHLLELGTKDEGACAVHACFGSASGSSSKVSCPQPRQLLADTLPEEFNVLLERVRLEKQQDTWDIMAGVWADVFKPFVKEGGAVDEERAFQKKGCS